MLHMFMSLALDKLAQSVQTQELRAMALLVVVAGKNLIRMFSLIVRFGVGLNLVSRSFIIDQELYKSCDNEPKLT